MAEKFPARVFQIALGAFRLDDPANRRPEFRKMVLENEIGRAVVQRLGDLARLIRAGEKYKRDACLLLARNRQGPQTFAGRATRIGQNQIDRLARHLPQEFLLAPHPDEVAFDSAVFQLCSDKLGIGVIGFEVNDLQ